MTVALTAPATWRRASGGRGSGASRSGDVRPARLENGSSRSGDVRPARLENAAPRNGHVRPAGLGNGASRNGDIRPAGLENGASKNGEVRPAGLENGASRNGEVRPAGLENGASRNGSARSQHGAFADAVPVGVSALGNADLDDFVSCGLQGAVVGFDGHVDAAVRRGARTLHAACAELLPGYSAATREPWRQSLLTAGCLDPHPRRAPTRRSAPPLVVEDVVQPSDVLCALWLARRCGLFSPGSPCGDGVGLRSACEIVLSFAPALVEERRAEVLDALRTNAAWRAHRLARAAIA